MIDAKWLGRWRAPYVVGAMIMLVVTMRNAGWFVAEPGILTGLIMVLDFIIIGTLIEICVLITERRKESE